MKITNLDKGKDYQLRPDTRIEIERTNPFFNDYAEQSVPLEIPASDHNCQLLGHPETFGLNQKQTAQRVSIQDGQFCAQSRQYVLSAQRRGSISTSFYLNDGAFYSRISDIDLKQVFADDIISFDGETTEARVLAGIQYCRTLRTNTDPRLTIFPVLLTDDSDRDDGYDFKVLNAFGKLITISREDTSYFHPSKSGDGCDFYNAVERTEYVGGQMVRLSPGYYISPFVRARYVLHKVFEHFGYTLQEGFFDQTPAFRDMVLLNNAIDPLVNGQLRIADLLPDVTVADFLSVWRRKFCCEFVTDEGNMTARAAFFKDVIGNDPAADLTDCLTAEPVFQYKAARDFKRIILKPKQTVPSETGDSFDSLNSLLKNTPGAFFLPSQGYFYKAGQSESGDRPVHVKIAEASMAYSAGDDMEAREIEIPECIPEFRNLHYTLTGDNAWPISLGTFLYVGDYRAIGSKIADSAGSDTSDTETTEKNAQLLPMLAFTYADSNVAAGTISPFAIKGGALELPEKIFSYALYYYGSCGIYERFWRDCDTYHRNSLQEVKMQLLLSQAQKQQLPATARVTVRGASFFLNKLKFTLGGKSEPVESELLSTALTEPLRRATPFMVLTDYIEAPLSTPST